MYMSQFSSTLCLRFNHVVCISSFFCTLCVTVHQMMTSDFTCLVTLPYRLRFSRRQPFEIELVLQGDLSLRKDSLSAFVTQCSTESDFLAKRKRKDLGRRISQK